MLPHHCARSPGQSLRPCKTNRGEEANLSNAAKTVDNDTMFCGVGRHRMIASCALACSIKYLLFFTTFFTGKATLAFAVPLARDWEALLPAMLRTDALTAHKTARGTLLFPELEQHICIYKQFSIHQYMQLNVYMYISKYIYIYIYIYTYIYIYKDIHMYICIYI